MSDRIPGYPDPSFNSEESEAYAPSEDAAEVPEALAASSRRFSGPQGSGSTTSETLFWCWTATEHSPIKPAWW